jgi:hypothetical protein
VMKYTVVAILFGGVLTSRGALAQESSACQAHPGFEASVASAKFILDFAEESSMDSAAYEDYQFVQRLNGLAKALMDFTAAYKSGQID